MYSNRRMRDYNDRVFLLSGKNLKKTQGNSESNKSLDTLIKPTPVAWTGFVE